MQRTCRLRGRALHISAQRCPCPPRCSPRAAARQAGAVHPEAEAAVARRLRHRLVAARQPSGPAQRWRGSGLCGLGCGGCAGGCCRGGGGCRGHAAQVGRGVTGRGGRHGLLGQRVLCSLCCFLLAWGYVAPCRGGFRAHSPPRMLRHAASVRKLCHLCCQLDALRPFFMAC